MRPMNRLARRAQAALRRPPQASWVAPLRKAALAGLGLFLVGFSASLVWRSAPVQAGLEEWRRSLLSAAAAQGFVVREVLAEGATQTDRRALLQMLAQYKDQNILAVELEEVRGRLGRLPWVREVSVARELPGTLRVRLKEHRAVARWFDGARQVLVSESGTVIPVPGTPRFKSLPLLAGAGAPERAAEATAILQADPALMRKVSYVQLVGGRRWNVYLDGRVEVRLPEREPERAWRRLAQEHQRTGLLARAIKSVDLRHSAWLSLELADELTGSGKGSGA